MQCFPTCFPLFILFAGDSSKRLVFLGSITESCSQCVARLHVIARTEQIMIEQFVEYQHFHKQCLSRVCALESADPPGFSSGAFLIIFILGI